MSAIQVTTANNNSMPNSARSVFRDSYGYPYIVSLDETTGTRIQVHSPQFTHLQDGTTNQIENDSVGQSFMADGNDLIATKIKLIKVGSPTGNMWAELYAHTGTFGTDGIPTGSPLATSDLVLRSSASLSISFVTFLFSGTNRYKTTKDTPYVIVFRGLKGDGSNVVRYFQTADNTNSGNACFTNDTSWSVHSSYDICFGYTLTSKTPETFYQIAQSLAQTAPTAISGAIDSGDYIHLVWIDNIGNSSDVKYVRFNCNTNGFGTEEILNADIGEAPTSSSLYTAIAIDSNNVPHIVNSRYGKIGGAATYSAWYLNKVGGSWNSAIAISNVKSEHCSSFDIIIGLDDCPVVSVELTPNNSNFLYHGDRNNVAVFQSGFAIQNWSCILVSHKGDYFHVGYASSGIQIKKSSFNTWDFSVIASNIGTSITYNYEVSAVIVGDIIYLFYERSSDNEICYQSFDVSGTPAVVDAETVLETGTFNNVRAKFGFWVDNDSNGKLRKSYNLINAASTSSENLTTPTTKVGQKFTALNGFTVSNVVFHGYRLSTPTDNVLCEIYYTEQDVIDLTNVVAQSSVVASSLALTMRQPILFEFSSPVQLTSDTVYFVVRRSGSTDTSNYVVLALSNSNEYADSVSFTATDASLTEDSNKDSYITLIAYKEPIELDYAFLDETASPDIWWNTLILQVPAVWTAKILKWYNGSSWVEKPLKYHNGSTWVTKPLKINA